jgi:hypothetical protein
MSEPGQDVERRRLYPATFSTGKRSAARNSVWPVASAAYSAPVQKDMRTSTRVQWSPRTGGWDDLDAVEQSLIAVAAREHTLDRACVSWSQRPRGHSEIAMTKHSAQALLNKGLIGFYRLEDGDPDLTQEELRTVFQENTYWDLGHVHAHGVGLFLTEAGEDVVLGT